MCGLGKPRAFCCSACIRDSKEEITCESSNPFVSSLGFFKVSENLTSDGPSIWKGLFSGERASLDLLDLRLEGLSEGLVRLGLLLSTRLRLEGLPSINLFRLRCHSFLANSGG